IAWHPACRAADKGADATLEPKRRCHLDAHLRPSRQSVALSAIVEAPIAPQTGWGPWDLQSSATALEDRRSDSERIFTDRRNGVGSSRWDFHKRQMPPGDAPSNHQGMR